MPFCLCCKQSISPTLSYPSSFRASNFPSSSLLLPFPKRLCRAPGGGGDLKRRLCSRSDDFRFLNGNFIFKLPPTNQPPKRGRERAATDTRNRKRADRRSNLFSNAWLPTVRIFFVWYRGWPPLPPKGTFHIAQSLQGRPARLRAHGLPFSASGDNGKSEKEAKGYYYLEKKALLLLQRRWWRRHPLPLFSRPQFSKGPSINSFLLLFPFLPKPDPQNSPQNHHRATSPFSQSCLLFPPPSFFFCFLLLFLPSFSTSPRRRIRKGEKILVFLFPPFSQPTRSAEEEGANSSGN